MFLPRHNVAHHGGHVAVVVMGEGEPAAGVDHSGRGVGRAGRSLRPHPRVLLPNRHARLLPRRDNDEDAEDADPSLDHLVHHHRSEVDGASRARRRGDVSGV